MVEKIKNSPPRKDEKYSSNQEARRFFMAQKYLMINEKTEIVLEDKNSELKMLKTYLEKVEQKKKKRKYTSLFSEKQKESIKSMDKTINKELKRKEAERKRKEEAERKRKEEEKKRRPKGWLCNFTHTLHPGGPNECGDPSQGGHWVT